MSTIASRIWREVRVAARETPAMYFSPVVSLGGMIIKRLERSDDPSPRHGKVFVPDISRTVRKGPKKLKHNRSASKR